MILLWCFERYAEIAEFDPELGVLSILGELKGIEADKARIAGTYLVTEEGLVAFYRIETKLFFRLGSLAVELYDSIVCRFGQHGSRKTLSFSSGDALLLSWSYEDPLPGLWFDDDITPGVEKEHFDLGLFVFNVMNQSGRRYRIFPDGLPDDIAAALD